MAHKPITSKELESVLSNDEKAFLPTDPLTRPNAILNRVRTIQKEAAREATAMDTPAKPDKTTLWRAQTVLKEHGISFKKDDFSSINDGLKQYQQEIGLAGVGFMSNGKMDPITSRIAQKEILDNNLDIAAAVPTRVKAEPPKVAEKTEPAKRVHVTLAAPKAAAQAPAEDHHFVDPHKFQVFLSNMKPALSGDTLASVWDSVAKRNFMPGRTPDATMEKMSPTEGLVSMPASLLSAPAAAPAAKAAPPRPVSHKPS